MKFCHKYYFLNHFCYYNLFHKVFIYFIFILNNTTHIFAVINKLINTDMCGILGIFGKNDLEVQHVQALSQRMSHRGPDMQDYQVNDSKTGIITHERLAIIDLHTGKQPIQGTTTAYVVHNGEIYNHIQLKKNELKEYIFRTTCDSEVIVKLYEKYGLDICNKLDGVFGFIIMDGDQYMVARDPIGIKPLYYGQDQEGAYYFASEMKVIEDQVEEVRAFPPGYYFTPTTGFVQYYKPEWQDVEACHDQLNLEHLREALIDATRKRLMSDVPLGVLLSGGLDSSLISSITARILKEEGKTLHSFSVGLDENAPDVIAAKEVATFIGTEHHTIQFSFEEGLAIIDQLIWHLETYDITSIRASTPMYIMSKYITDMGIKVVLSGEGSDEIFGGYLYFHNAPSDEEFQKETIRRVQLLSTADCLRADKSTMAWALEARVPFLDRHFLDVAMKIDPSFKRPDRSAGKMEKHILRLAFDDQENPWLPADILWRQKEQFSDGVGYSWIDQLVDYCADQITDEEMLQAETLFPINPPTTKEAMYMRKIFHAHFPSDTAAKTVKKWIPKWQENADPSGRASTIHEQTTEVNKVAI